MGKLTNNIWRHELACKCGCGFDTMDWETIQAVQGAADHFSKKLGKTPEELQTFFNQAALQ